jgi:dTDP-4-dehydrorhamnose 3,5-epimerase
MKLTPTTLPDVVIVEPQVFEDDRGWFMETFNEPRFHRALQELGLPVPGAFVQDNHSCSHKGVLRGLHYQSEPHAQGKLVRVAHGSAWDVSVDIRPASPTRGQWVAVELSARNRRQVWIPPGFAHGFLALEDDTHLLYKATAVYERGSEGSIVWNDPLLCIDWPLSRIGQSPKLAAKDAGARGFR